MMTRTFDRMRLALCALALASGAAFAAEGSSSLPYTYVDVDLVSVDAGGGSESGIGLDGSYSFNDLWYGVASLSDVDTVTAFGVGAGLRADLSPKLHVFGDLRIISVDAGGGSDTGFQLGGGLRGMAAPALELYGRIDHVDIFNGSDDSLTVGGVYYFDAVGVQASFTSNDSADAIAIGVRFSF